MQNNSVHVKNDEELDSACAGHRSVRIMRILLKRGKKKKKAENNVHLPAFLSVEIIHREISD